MRELNDTDNLIGMCFAMPPADLRLAERTFW